MRRQGEVILKLLWIFLLFQHCFQETKGIIQLKPQQVLAQAKIQQNPQIIQPQQQQQQQQPSMNQHAAMQQQQQQSQQLVLQNPKNPNEKETIPEAVNQEIEHTNSYETITETKRENHLPPPLLKIPLSPSGLSLQRGSSLPPPAWSPNPFMNHGFGSPQPPPPPPPSAYTPHPYPITPYDIPPFPSSPYTTIPYQTSPFFSTPKFLPFMGYPHFFLPYSPFYSPELFYSPYPSGINDFEEVTSRASSGRRPPLTNPRDSPIYYMRLPPTPYMFMPNFGYQTSQNTPPLNYGSNFPHIIPIQPIQNSFPGMGHTFNLPINFISNGKPSGIHSFIPDIHNSPPFSGFNGFSPRPQGPPLSGNYFQSHYNSPPPPPPLPPYQNSKLTSLKQPFYFNGRPDDIYVLQNNINPLFAEL